ncbi:MAG: hypothetical protein JO097_03690 [Acidobacteriaceae bacterium]|nr:hypothetical protein [Acidobacteriaceae bacterium]
MSDREWVRSECETCGAVPQKDKHGLFRCKCAKIWQLRTGVAGAQDEETRLRTHGFMRTEDAQGEIYYVLSNSGHIIYLYADGTWFSDKAAKGSSLDAYLKWIDDVSAPLRAVGL